MKILEVLDKMAGVSSIWVAPATRLFQDGRVVVKLREAALYLRFITNIAPY